MEESTLSNTYVFRGIEYIVTMCLQSGCQLLVEVEDRLTADQWRATFDSAYIEDLTHKTGNFKQFNIFVSMLESAITQTTDSVSLDLLTYADLESLRQRKAGTSVKSSVPAARTSTLNSKRYLILTYTVEFDRIHYPLPLPYMGKPDPRALQETIRHLRAEIKTSRIQGASDHKGKEYDKLQKNFNSVLKEKEDLESEFMQYRRELKNTATGSAMKEIKMLKGIVRNLEEELMKEKTRYQRSASKRGQEYRELLEEVEELRASERKLQVRVKSLTNELAIYKRDRVRPSHRSSRPPARDTSQRFPSRDRSVSRDRSLSRDRSWSQDRLSQRERSSSRDRPSSAPNTSRLSDWSSRNKHRYTNPRSRTPSPSPAGARLPRFDPTAYCKDRNRRKKETDMKKKRDVRSNLSGLSQKSNRSNSSRISNSRIAAQRRNRSRTSSFGSEGQLSDGGMSDSSCGRLRNSNRNSKLDQSGGSYLSSPEVVSVFFLDVHTLASTPDSEYQKHRSRVGNKQNCPESGDDTDYFDRSEEISEIDARLNRLQELMKSSLP
ncbi:hypothetical protein ScPMuIL_014524 [Solemya velum]